MKLAYKTADGKDKLDIRDPKSGALLEQVSLPDGYPVECLELADDETPPAGYLIADGGMDEIRALQAPHAAAVAVVASKLASTQAVPTDELADIKARLDALEKP